MSVPVRASAVLSGERRWWLALAGVTLVAAVLRLIALSTVPENLFYDAAVRSMTLSLHNFFYGAFDPSAATSIDKPACSATASENSAARIGARRPMRPFAKSSSASLAATGPSKPCAC